jgi:transcriptional regulator with XRE-family HTH domain
MDAKLFGPRLREFREGAGLSQKELAEKMGVRQVTISAWEVGTRGPDLPMLVKLAEFFGVTVNDFLEPAKRKKK